MRVFTEKSRRFAARLRENFIRLGLNLLIAVLLGVLFLQCGLYVRQYIRQSRIENTLPMDLRLLSTSAQDVSRDLDVSLLLPQAAAVRPLDGDASAVLNSAAVMEELYGEISQCLSSALAGEGVPCEESNWQQALKGAWVYARYSAELPYQVVYAFSAAADGGEELRQADTYIGVREILLVTDTEEPYFRSVLVRGEGGIYEFPLETKKPFTDFFSYAVTYSDAFYPCRLETDGGGIRLITEEQILARTVRPGEGDLSLIWENTEDFRSVLRVLDFNPDKLNHHTETDGAEVFVESHGVLRADNISLSYQATETGGLSLDGFGVTENQRGDIYDYLRTASYLIGFLDKMDSQYVGGDAGLYLESVAAEGDSIVLSFAYRCDNIAVIFGGDGTGLRLAFSGDTLTEIQYRAMHVQKAPEYRLVMMQEWVQKQLSLGVDRDMYLVYSMDGSGGEAEAQWMLLSGAAARKR